MFPGDSRSIFNPELRLCILFICELAVIAEQHLRRVPHFERDARCVLALRQPVGRVAVSQNVVRPFDAGGFACAIARSAACSLGKIAPDLRAIRREPPSSLAESEPAGASQFLLFLSDLDVSAREIYVLPFQANQLRRSQSGESSDRKIKFGLFVDGIE